jgi:hypothetical protein
LDSELQIINYKSFNKRKGVHNYLYPATTLLEKIVVNTMGEKFRYVENKHPSYCDRCIPLEFGYGIYVEKKEEKDPFMEAYRIFREEGRIVNPIIHSSETKHLK